MIVRQALPAGTYVFKLIDSTTTNNIVQVFDQTERHLLATFLAIPDHKRQASSQTNVMFEERPSDTPEAVRAIFCHGGSYARELVYPKARAISQRTH